MTALEGFANNSTVIVPNDADVKQLEVRGTGQHFSLAFRTNNSEIRKAILGDSVSTGEDDKGVKAAKQTSMTVVDLRARHYKNTIAGIVKRDIYRLLTVVNYGEEMAHLTPDCSLGDTERRDWETTADALSKIGYQIAPEHQREGDAILGFTPRDKETLQENEAAPQFEEQETEETE